MKPEPTMINLVNLRDIYLLVLVDPTDVVLQYYFYSDDRSGIV